MFLLVALASPAMQSADAPLLGNITVMVKDAAGAPVKWADVRIKVLQKKFSNEALAEGKTNSEGKITLRDIPAGDRWLVAQSWSKEQILRGGQEIKIKTGETVEVELIVTKSDAAAQTGAPVK